jgi:hypothetical protein
MTTTEIELSDPSRELGLLAEYLRKFTGAGDSDQTYVALAKAINVANDSPDYLDAIAEVSLRIQRLSKFATQVADPDFDEELRADVISATSTLAHLFTPAQSMIPWKDAKQRFIQDNHLRILKWFGPTAKRYKPLRVIKSEEVTSALDKLNEVIEEIETGEPHWSNAPLINGLQRLQRVLKHLNFFGHEAAIDQILLFSNRTIAIKEAMEKEESLSDQRSIFKVLNIIALIGALFCLPPQAVDAIGRYEDWGLNRAIEAVESHFEQRLLPPPEKYLPPETEKAMLNQGSESKKSD